MTESIEFPWFPKWLNPNNRPLKVKFYNNVFQKYKNDCYVLALGKEPILKGRIIFCQPKGRGRNVDKDNCIAAIKALQDSLALAWKIDDNKFDFSYHMSDRVENGCVILLPEWD